VLETFPRERKKRKKKVWRMDHLQKRDKTGRENGTGKTNR